MPPVSRLGRQIAEVTAALNAIGVRFALIGGLAVASHWPTPKNWGPLSATCAS